MLDNSSIEKNQKKNKEIIQTKDEISTKIKIFTYFYHIILKKDFNIFILSFFLIIESIQVISFGISDPHTKIWKIKTNKINNINTFIGAVRITQILKYVSFKIYLIIWGATIFILFSSILLVLMAIKINKPNSGFYKFVISFGKNVSSIILSIGLIPSTEILLLMLKCNNNKIDIVKNPITCYQGIHYLYMALSIFFLFIHYLLLFLFVFFSFNPFDSEKLNNKLDTRADLYYYIFSLINILRYTFIKNVWISVAILIVGSVFNLKKSFNEPTYRNFLLQCLVIIRNSLLLWMSFMVMISKLTLNSKFDGNFYLYILGIPIVILISSIFYKKISENLVITNVNSNNTNDFLNKTKSSITLIEKFIEKNQSIENSKKGYDKYDIFLKGLITRHIETCINEECPLAKFLENQGNYQVQKNCLLHYINVILIDGIKRFSNNKEIIMEFVQFNYINKFNLNAAKAYLTKLEKETNTITEDYILFCIKQKVNSTNKNKIYSETNNDLEKIEDFSKQKFKKLKVLIESTTKLYGEFWGVLSTNLTNNLNLEKLYFLGNKLNVLLDEINQLWEKDLKSKKIDIENQSIVQLYMYFVREILRNKKKSDEIYRKLSQEQRFESKKSENDRLYLDNLDLLLENQEQVIYCRTNEKGDCSILQLSNTVVNLLGFTRHDLIGKKIEILMPSIFINGHSKVVSNQIKHLRKLNPTMNKISDKKQIFILPRTKIGYIIPVLGKFTLYNDDDFSNTFIFKMSIQNKDPKYVYAFYILTKDDFTVDSFSSSAMTMGLSMDLLKKYVINLDLLIRNTINLDSFNLKERYIEFEQEQKKITWIFPDLIYPKNDNHRKNEEYIEKLVKKSRKKDFYLLITKMKFGDDLPIGYCLRFTSVETKKVNCEVNDFKMSENKLVMYDILKLNYIRTDLIINNRPSLCNNIFARRKSKINTKDISHIQQEILKKKSKKNNKKIKIKNESEEEEENEKIEDIYLTKESIIELQNKTSKDINDFINSIKYFGQDIVLEKHRPNKERYLVGKRTEPNIKIQISSFIKKIEEKIKNYPEISKTYYQNRRQMNQNSPQRNKNHLKRENQVIINVVKENNNNNHNINNNISNEANNEITLSLNNIFNEKSVTYIKITTVFMFILMIILISLEFAFSLYYTKKCGKYLKYLDDSYILLNSFMYTKFFITEVILSQNSSYTDSLKLNQKEYLFEIKNELVEYRQIINDYISFFNNATVKFNDEYFNYINNVKICVRTLSNLNPTTELLSYSSAISRIKTAIFFFSTITDNDFSIDMNNRNAYELMMNLLNDYLLVHRNVTFILAKNIIQTTKFPFVILILFILSFIFVLIDLFSMYKLICKFIDDREKPVDLFLTIKKKKFEELKLISETFLNKLLNKFFGNEDTEEGQSIIEYTISSKDEDIIMITKFKQKNDYRQSIRNSSEYFLAFIYIILFFLLIQVYMIFKFVYLKNIMGNIKNYAYVFNTTHYTQTSLILFVNVYKSFYYNSSIPIINSSNVEDIFYENTIRMTKPFQKFTQDSFLTNSFLKDKYLSEFSARMSTDISDILSNSSLKELSSYVNYQNGFNCICTKYFEINKFLAILYIYEKNTLTQPNFCYNPKFIEVNNVLIKIIRPWFNYMIGELKDNYFDYQEKIKLIFASTFVALLIFIIVIYLIVWKSYEEKLKNLLKTSVDLIKLIPDEIKIEIVKKLNEEEEKNE